MSSLLTGPGPVRADDIASGEVLIQDADELSSRVIAKMGLNAEQRMAVTGKTELLERQFRALDEHLQPFGEEMTGLVALSSAYDPWHDCLRLQGVYKGGWRLDTSVTGPEMCFLSRGMLDKADVLGIYKEGGKSGVPIDANHYTPAELVGVARGFAVCFRDILGSTYVAATDLGSKPEHMAVMAEIVGPDGVTGKPGALPGQSLCTGYGAAVMAHLAAGHYGMPLEFGTPVIVHGFGKAGQVMARFLQRWGCRIVGVADEWGNIKSKSNIDVDDLSRHTKVTGSVAGFRDTTMVDDEEWLGLNAVLLAVASKENILTVDNANLVQADLVAGPANGFGTWGAQEILRANGKIYLTDRLDSIYGVYGSDLELAHFKGDQDAVLERVHDRASQDFQAVMKVMRQFDIHTLTEGAQALAYSNRLASMGISLN